MNLGTEERMDEKLNKKDLTTFTFTPMLDRPTDRPLRVLVACEESQRVCIAFRERGHEAFSCDISECSGGHPEWHIRGDCLPLLNGNVSFTTDDGTQRVIQGRWDLIIGFPPCTYLTNAGAARLFRNVHDGEFQMVNIERLKNGILGRDLFMAILHADCDRIAVENPVPSSIFCMPKASQIIQPYNFGHPFSKKTCLWLKNLPPLLPTEIVVPKGSWVSGGSKKADGSPRENKGETFRDSYTKSKTFPGIARAMALYWG